MPQLRKGIGGDSLLQTGGSNDAVHVSAPEVVDVLCSIDKQLKIMNLHLEILSDNNFATRDVEP